MDTLGPGAKAKGELSLPETNTWFFHFCYKYLSKSGEYSSWVEPCFLQIHIVILRFKDREKVLVVNAGQFGILCGYGCILSHHPY